MEEQTFGSLSSGDIIMWYIIVAQNASTRVVAQTGAFYMVEVLYFPRYVFGLFGESEMGLGWAANGLKRLDKGGD